MKNKKIIMALDGVKNGKTKFLEIARNENKKYYDDDGWWIWNINVNNVLQLGLKRLNISQKDNKFYKFLGEFRNLINKYYGFEEIYSRKMIDKFMNNPNTDILIFHNIDSKLIGNLKKEFDIYILAIGEEKDKNEFKYICDETLFWDAQNFSDNIYDLLDGLSK